MSGPMLAMASAVESTNPVAFHRSHSTPDLLLMSSLPGQASSFSSFHRHTTAATHPHISATTTSTDLRASPSTTNLASTPARPVRGSASSPVDLTFKSLPSLPTFDIPLFDFDIDTDLEFASLREIKKKPAKEKPVDRRRRVWEEFVKPDRDLATLNSFGTGGAGEGAGTTPAVGGGGTDSNKNRSNIFSSSPNYTKYPAKEEAFYSSSAASSPVLSASPILRKNSPAAKETVEEVERVGLVIGVEKSSRKRALIDKPRSWIHNSRSSPNVRALALQDLEKEALQETADAEAAISATERYEGSVDTTSPVTSTAPTNEIMVERPRTVSASFVDFAKRSWISRSPSPSSQSTSKKTANLKDKPKDDSGLFGGKLSRKRPVSTVFLFDSSDKSSSTVSLPAIKPFASDIEICSRSDSSSSESKYSMNSKEDIKIGDNSHGTQEVEFFVNNSDSVHSAFEPSLGTAVANGATSAAPAPETPSAANVANTTSTSRAFSRAGEYLTRMKQRPQSILVTPDAGNSSFADVQIDNIDAANRSGDGSNADADESHGSPAPTIPLPLQLPTLGLPVEEDVTISRASLQTSSSSSAHSSAHSSTNGSAVQAASEAGSLTTADTSNHSSPMTQPASRDPLWVAFKDLEVNFFKFLSKTNTAQRVILIRASLVPFLRRYSLDSSNKNTSLLSPEDIERRASILNRWWTSLLDLLDSSSQWQNEQSQGSLLSTISGNGTYFPTQNTPGGNFQPLSGVDRPAVLEAVSMIMSRPEWRLLTTVFRPLADRSPGERVRARANTADSPPLEECSMFVEESAEHNVRNMFVNNLLAQLVLVVDKMTMRHTPLSIVNFSGKACAYAFFFVPGVADILVRLWGLDKNIDLVRRTADAFGLPRRSSKESEDLIALFPPCIGPLGWSSVNAMQAKLRRAPKLSLLGSTTVVAGSRIPWFAPYWLSRWRGDETDLLFVFSKYYHVLADEFMPSMLGLPLVEKARAPAYVLLHAQLLHILDTTIHRQAAVEAAMMAAPAIAEGGSSLWTQQEQQQASIMPDSVSASASSDAFLPPMLLQPSHNLFREMDENRIIALLRDLLDADVTLFGARDTFAESIMALLKGAASRTSQYDHNACYMLCDFLHEILLAFDTFYGYYDGDNGISDVFHPPVDFVDWTFWLDVCKMMLASNNTMSEIRVLSFIFSTWDIIAADTGRKEELCMNWLLTEDVFDKMFNNWCPMVRAYYMRLLCWRMCRDTGSPNELDTEIYVMVYECLKTAWSHYLWLKRKADLDGSLQPSTAPALPQPGKRFMIVRTEVDTPQNGLLANNGNGYNNVATSFDAMSIPFNGGANGSSSYSDDRKEDNGSAKKKWSILGKVLNLTAGTSGKLSDEEQLEQIRRETAISRSSLTSRLGSPSAESDSTTGSAPVFESQFVFKFMLHNIPWQNYGGASGCVMMPPAYRERVLTLPQLPLLAQARVNSLRTASNNRTSSPSLSATGMPPSITRRVSGVAMGGLINEARNANPEDAIPIPSSGRRMSVSSVTSSVYGREDSSTANSSGEWERRNSSTFAGYDRSQDNTVDQEYEAERLSVQPTEPKGHGALLRAKYSGRALAEWGLVVNECNSFIDRRRDEGVFGLQDVEVPTLGVEALRRLC